MIGGASVSVVVPARNEERNIREAVRGVLPFADELIVVDGHSTDRTREAAAELGVRVVLDGGRGKGDGIRTGIREASGDVIVFFDADGSHAPEDIPRLVRPIDEGRADLVVGSRFTGGSDELTGDIGKFIRVTGSHALLLLVNYRWRVRLTDNQNGFRAIRARAARVLDLRENLHTIEQEMVMQCLRRGLRVAEVPSHEYARRHGTSSIDVWRVWPRYLWCALRECFLRRE